METLPAIKNCVRDLNITQEDYIGNNTDKATDYGRKLSYLYSLEARG